MRSVRRNGDIFVIVAVFIILETLAYVYVSSNDPPFGWKVAIYTITGLVWFLLVLLLMIYIAIWRTDTRN